MSEKRKNVVYDAEGRARKAGVVLLDYGNVLLVDTKGGLALPKGHLEYIGKGHNRRPEVPKYTAFRETVEETGFVPEVGKRITVHKGYSRFAHEPFATEYFAARSLGMTSRQPDHTPLFLPIDEAVQALQESEKPELAGVVAMACRNTFFAHLVDMPDAA